MIHKCVLIAFLLVIQYCVAVKQGGKYFDRILIVNFENTYINSTLKQPYFSKLTYNGTLLTNYHGVTHPSQPNYIAQVCVVLSVLSVLSIHTLCLYIDCR
jgi:hypothetical protein